MKSVLVLSGLLAGWLTCQQVRAQGIVPSSGTSYKEAAAAKPGQEEVTILKKNKDMQVIQTTGKTYNNEDLSRLAAKEVNTVAGTAPGVDYRPGSGQAPIIRGADHGTAYYVDGIRVYGTLPTLHK